MLDMPKLGAPVTCIEDMCMRKGIQVFGNRKLCLECGSELFPVTDLENLLEDELDPQEMLGLYQPTNGVQRYSPTIITTPKANDTFTCPPDISGCPIAKSSKVYLPIEIFNKAVFLADQLHTEWMAYLLGSEIRPGEYEVTEMYFPKQKANAVHVEAEDREIREGTIGCLHSHVGMEVFFSPEDILHMNHPIELVINNKGQIAANGRTQLECGRMHRGNAEVVFVNCADELVLLEELKSKIVPDTTRFVVNGRAESL